MFRLTNAYPCIRARRAFLVRSFSAPLESRGFAEVENLRGSVLFLFLLRERCSPPLGLRVRAVFRTKHLFRRESLVTIHAHAYYWDLQYIQHRSNAFFYHL